MICKVLLAKEREVEITGDNINELWEAAKMEKSEDERIVSIKMR